MGYSMQRSICQSHPGTVLLLPPTNNSAEKGISQAVDGKYQTKDCQKVKTSIQDPVVMGKCPKVSSTETDM